MSIFKKREAIRFTTDVRNSDDDTVRIGTEGMVKEVDPERGERPILVDFPHRVEHAAIWVREDEIEPINKPDQIGRILYPNAMMMRIEGATATSDEGNEYEIGANIQGIPYVFSHQTGRYWVIDYTQLLTLARQAGIDQVEACSFAKKEKEES